MNSHASLSVVSGTSQWQSRQVQPSNKSCPHTSQISSSFSSTQCLQPGLGGGSSSPFLDLYGPCICAYVTVDSCPPLKEEAEVRIPLIAIVGVATAEFPAYAMPRLLVLILPIEAIEATGACAKPEELTSCMRAELVAYT